MKAVYISIILGAAAAFAALAAPMGQAGIPSHVGGGFSCGVPEGGQGSRGLRTASGQFGPQHGPSDEERERNRVRMGITKEQQARIESLFKETGQRMGELHKQRGEKFQALREEYKKYRFDRGKVRAIREELFKLYRQISDIQAENEERLRKILNEAQFIKLQQIMQERMQQWQKDHPRGGGPGGRGSGERGGPGGPPGV